MLAASEQTGTYIAATKDKRHVFITGHPEYDANTLAEEYARDLANGQNTALPENYFFNNDPTQAPRVSWRSHGTLLYTNWLNYYVYQTTPYDLTTLT